MRQSNICARTITVAEPNVAVTAPGFTLLNVSKAWQYSTGNGVPVAVIDTGVNPSPATAGGSGRRLHHGRRRADGLRLARHRRGVADRGRAARHSDARPDAGRARVPATGGSTAGRWGTTAARWTAAADRAAAAAVAGDDHRNQTRSAAAATAPAGRAVKRAGRPGPGGAPDDPEVPPLHQARRTVSAGVAPHARIISIRQSSRAYELERPAAATRRPARRPAPSPRWPARSCTRPTWAPK